MYKTVIIPIDISHADRVKPMIEAAKQLGEKDTKYVLTSVIENGPTYVEAQIPAEIREKLNADVREQLEAIASESGLGPEIDVRNGQPANEILALANEKGADVIVVASHQPGFGDFLIGSTAARVVRHASCSVHVLR